MQGGTEQHRRGIELGKCCQYLRSHATNGWNSEHHLARLLSIGAMVWYCTPSGAEPQPWIEDNRCFWAPFPEQCADFRRPLTNNGCVCTCTLVCAEHKQVILGSKQPPVANEMLLDIWEEASIVVMYEKHAWNAHCGCRSLNHQRFVPGKLGETECVEGFTNQGPKEQLDTVS